MAIEQFVVRNTTNGYIYTERGERADVTGDLEILTTEQEIEVGYRDAPAAPAEKAKAAK